MNGCEQATQWVVKELRAAMSGSPSVYVAPGDADMLPSKAGVYVSVEEAMFREEHADVVTVRVDVAVKNTRTACASVSARVRQSLHQPSFRKNTWHVSPETIGLRLKACRFVRGAPPGKPSDATQDFYVASLWFSLTCSP